MRSRNVNGKLLMIAGMRPRLTAGYHRPRNTNGPYGPFVLRDFVARTVQPQAGAFLCLTLKFTGLLLAGIVANMYGWLNALG